MNTHEKLSYVEFPASNIEATKAFFSAALLVFYSKAIEDTLHKVEDAGGRIVKPIFEFPGGCRFHFIEPSGNEFAVWSDTVPKS